MKNDPVPETAGAILKDDPMPATSLYLDCQETQPIDIMDVPILKDAAEKEAWAPNAEPRCGQAAADAAAAEVAPYAAPADEEFTGSDEEVGVGCFQLLHFSKGMLYEYGFIC